MLCLFVQLSAAAACRLFVLCARCCCWFVFMRLQFFLASLSFEQTQPDTETHTQLASVDSLLYLLEAAAAAAVKASTRRTNDEARAKKRKREKNKLEESSKRLSREQSCALTSDLGLKHNSHTHTHKVSLCDSRTFAQ